MENRGRAHVSSLTRANAKKDLPDLLREIPCGGYRSPQTPSGPLTRPHDFRGDFHLQSVDLDLPRWRWWDSNPRPLHCERTVLSLLTRSFPRTFLVASF